MSETTNKNSHSIFQIALLAAVTASTGWSIDLCLPALPFIAESLEADMGQVQQTLSVFILGVAFGQLVYGPLSDRFGRKPVLVFGFSVFVIGSLLCASAQSVERLIASGVASSVMGAGRFLFGFVTSMMVGVFNNGTPVPMAAIICASSVLAFLS